MSDHQSRSVMLCILTIGHTLYADAIVVESYKLTVFVTNEYSIVTLFVFISVLITA